MTGPLPLSLSLSLSFSITIVLTSCSGNTKLPSTTIPLVSTATRADAVELADLLYHLKLQELVKDILVRERLVASGASSLSSSLSSARTIDREYVVSLSLDAGYFLMVSIHVAVRMNSFYCSKERSSQIELGRYESLSRKEVAHKNHLNA